MENNVRTVQPQTEDKLHSQPEPNTPLSRSPSDNFNLLTGGSMPTVIHLSFLYTKSLGLVPKHHGVFYFRCTDSTLLLFFSTRRYRTESSSWRKNLSPTDQSKVSTPQP
ncbi:Histone-lysine N-methyltransferase set9 [Clarias magur]|uniref:Histone-lysine N-methyltransferase set9 n=1 Tax=Clarias magur TaxID=1594786 RepID=A0A8J4WXK3_CLAMG|nr:Histone-lysine N-methyltransferase set9 [Clarias magur]